MKYEVTEQCIGCGLCVEICPEVFSMTDAGVATAQDQRFPSPPPPKRPKTAARSVRFRPKAKDIGCSWM